MVIVKSILFRVALKQNGGGIEDIRCHYLLLLKYCGIYHLHGFISTGLTSNTMDVSDNEKFNAAYSQYQQGNYKMAQSSILDIYRTTKSDLTKLQCIMGLVAPINHENPDETINYCNEGITLAEGFKRIGEFSYLRACKGYMLIIKASPKAHRQGELTLAPGWFGFSLETEKQEYDKLNNEVEALFKGMTRLLDQGEKVAVDLPKKSYLAHILTFKGLALSQKYLILQLMAIKEFRFKKLTKWFRFNLFLLKNKTTKIKLLNIRREFKEAFLKSYKIFIEQADITNAGYALYNLANSLRGFLSIRFLRRAERLARKSKDNTLLIMCGKLGAKITGYSFLKFFY